MVTTLDKLPLAAEDCDTKVFNKLPRLSTVKVEAVGRWHEAYCLRQLNRQSLSHHSLGVASSSSESESELSADDEDDAQFFQTLDPKEWKNQDHYAVLGLKKLRNKATDDQIKRAYKKKVLKHHPDKRRARGIPVNEGEEDYFTCITRAWETLGNPTRRRAYDSVDPEFDNSVPPDNPESRENFFKIFAPVFERNARWSKKSKCPLLGDENEAFDKVDDFYSFWYEFDSWREYSYLDEEEKEKGENREERRWIEKQNKAARAKLKKEEVVRIRQLVDNAYACDPRIAKHKEEEKLKKQRIKDERKEQARKRQEEEERVKKEAAEVEKAKRDKEEEEAREKAAVLKKEKEAQKKAMKKERKTLRNQLKDFDYFGQDDAEKVKNMAEMETLAENLSLVSIQELNAELTSGDKDRAKTAFQKQVSELAAKKEKETQELLEQVQRQGGGGGAGGAKASGKGQWSEEEVQLLIKGVNLFPAGTVQRWETVASFITQHCSTSHRSAKEVLAKAKDLQKNDANLKESANKGAFERFSKDMKGAASTDKSEASQRYMSVAESHLLEMGTNPAPWTADEQKHLEQAMRTYGASVENRWEKIAECIPNRSKKDCMKRYKELVEMIKAKKLAQLDAQKKTTAAKK